MKVLQLCSGLSIKQGGTTQAVKGLSKALASSGIDVTVITTDVDTDIDINEQEPFRRIEEDGYEIFYFHSPYLKSYGFSPHLLSWLKNNITEFDILHIHPIFNLSTPFAVWLCQRYNLPYIISPSGMLNSYWAFKKNVILKKIYLFLLERKNLNYAKAIHFTSYAELEDARRLKIKTPGHIIPWGLEFCGYGANLSKGAFRLMYDIPEDKKIMLFLSRIDPKKGLESLILSLSKILKERDDVIFILAGAGKKSYENKIKCLLEDYRILDKTKIIGFASGAKRLSLLRDADIFVLPSYYENFGFAVVEAMAFGLPVVISHYIDIYPDILKYKAGIVTDNSPEHISIQLEKLLDDDRLRLQMGENAKLLVREIFDWKKLCPKFIELYKGCLN